MPWQGTIQAGLSNVFVGGLGPYNAGDTVVISDRNYARMNPSGFLNVFTAAPTSLSGSGGGSVFRDAKAIVTPGDITLPNTSGAWQLLASIPELNIAAAAGDEIEVSVSALHSQSSSGFLDVAIVTGATPTVVRYLSSGTATPAIEGEPGWYPAGGFNPLSGPIVTTVASGDLDTGKVRLRIAVKAAGTGTLYASTNYPFKWNVKNFGPSS